MLKQIIFIFLFFAIDVSIAQDLTASQKIPDSFAAGSNFIVTTTITRGQIIDFMEFLQPLPKGFSASNIESEGGDFEFDKNEVKIIWLFPPQEDAYDISYLVNVPSDISGTATFGGKIIYITSKNEHKVFMFQPKKIETSARGSLVKEKMQKPIQVVPEFEKTSTLETTHFADTGLSSHNSKSGATRANNDATLAQLKATLESDQIEINRLKTELENTTVSQKNLLNTISSKNNASVAKTDILLAQLKMKSDRNQFEINRLKAELEKAKIAAANTLKSINSKNTASNAEAEVMLSQIKTKSDSGQAEINRLKAELEKIKVSAKNTSNAVNSTGVVIRNSESDYFLDDTGKPVNNGFYVVIGTFGNKANAERFRAANVIKGILNTKIIQNQFTKVYNIYVLKTNNRADADSERMKYMAEYPDVWLLKLE